MAVDLKSPYNRTRSEDSQSFCSSSSSSAATTLLMVVVTEHLLTRTPATRTAPQLTDCEVITKWM